MLRTKPVEVLGMYSEMIRTLDHNTLKFIVEELQQEVEQEKASKEAAVKAAQAEKETAMEAAEKAKQAAKDAEQREKAARAEIEELKRQLTELKRQ